jgi:hypothetical protein
MYHGTCRAQIKIFRFITIYFGFGLAQRPWPATHASRWKFSVRRNPYCSQEKRHSISNSEDPLDVPPDFRLCPHGMSASLASAQGAGEKNSAAGGPCQIEAVDYKGWHTQQLSNAWVKLIVVPQNGGRLMQVIFAGHPYLFVNPQYEGKYLPPNEEQWFNYGGDKLWLLPEGDDDEQHWRGNSDLLDDGTYSFQVHSSGQRCEIDLSSPADPRTGIQILRTIRLEGDSPRIHFHALMKNISGHSVEWSVQSVSQYDTADPNQRSRQNRDFWTFTPANPSSSYLNRYHVRSGPAEPHTISIRDDGLFALRYAYIARELWLDSHDGWLAVVDAGSRYAMVERFRYEDTNSYPGKASVIFYTNGPELRWDAEGVPSLSSGEDRKAPYYLEAELNSPLVRLLPEETYSFDTEWFPTRAGREFHGVTEAGVIVNPFRAMVLENGKLRLSGSFGVFFPGRLVAHFYGQQGGATGAMPVAEVEPADLASLSIEIPAVGNAGRVSLHLEDKNGLDRGALGEVRIEAISGKH